MEPSYDVACLSHLRWDFVFQRPQHLLVRCARQHRVFFVEEPRFGAICPRLDVHQVEEGIVVLVPHLQDGLPDDMASSLQRGMLQGFMRENNVQQYVLWYYTPMAMAFTEELTPLVTVYDCMDELSAFQGAPLQMRQSEQQLFNRADLVFTGGYSLYEAKRSQHPNVHVFPSSVDVEHFARARETVPDPQDQRLIPRPRIGYYGVIDERLDSGLIASIAEAHPEWQIVMVGPVVKVDPDALPRATNIHYLGPKQYNELPDYLAGWDVAIMPFALNEATRFISPTKTPEYLAGGKPVVSTPIRDVVLQYGNPGLVRTADSPAEFIRAIEASLLPQTATHQRRVDEMLGSMSWDCTWQAMQELIEREISARHSATNSTRSASSSDFTQNARIEG